MAEAQIQQLHAQVVLLTQQIQHLNGLADSQAQKIASINDCEKLRDTVINMQQEQNMPDAGRNSGGGDVTKYLVNIKDVKINKFYGDEAKFTDFVEYSKTYTDVIFPELGEMFVWLEYQPKDDRGERHPQPHWLSVL